MKLEVIYLSPHDLKPYDGNARKHNPDDIEQIKESINIDGFNDPIGIWGDENIIVEGHGRQIAAIEMGLEKVPCIRLDHLTDTQRRDYAIRHNRTAELSSWDFGKLEEEIARLEIENIDLSGLKFDFANEEDFGEEFQLDSGDREPFTNMTFTLANEQAERIKEALNAVKGECVETFGNENSNGNALYEVVRQWQAQRT